VEKLLEFSVEAQKVEQGASRQEIDEEVDVAVVALLAAGDRTEQSHPDAMVPCGDRPDGVAVLLDEGTQRRPVHAVILGRRHA